MVCMVSMVWMDGVSGWMDGEIDVDDDR